MAYSSRRQRKAAASSPALQTRPAMSWADAELYEESGYIGIHDLMYSPEAAEAYLGPLVFPDGMRDIPIRNRLVKHAALAYLRPMSAASSRFAPRRKPPSVLRRLLDPLYDAVRCLMEVVCAQWDVDPEEETERSARRMRR